MHACVLHNFINETASIYFYFLHGYCIVISLYYSSLIRKLAIWFRRNAIIISGSTLLESQIRKTFLFNNAYPLVISYSIEIDFFLNEWLVRVSSKTSHGKCEYLFIYFLPAEPTSLLAFFLTIDWFQRSSSTSLLTERFFLFTHILLYLQSNNDTVCDDIIMKYFIKNSF